MKIRMEEGLLLVVTPESYVEQVALAKWAETHQGEGDLLIESYAQQPHALDEAYCTCKNPDVYINRICKICGKPHALRQ